MGVLVTVPGDGHTPIHLTPVLAPGTVFGSLQPARFPWRVGFVPAHGTLRGLPWSEPPDLYSA
jgi:hypothetical protein